MMCITRDEALAIVADMACPTVYNLFSNLISKRYEFIDENYKEPYFPDDSSEIVQKGYLLYHFLENNCIEEITGFNYFEFTILRRKAPSFRSGISGATTQQF